MGWQANETNWLGSAEALPNILELEYKEKEYLSKEQVASQWLVSKGTFENWLKYEPPNPDQFKTEKAGKKLFEKNYVESLVKKFGKKKIESAEPLPSQNNENDKRWQKIVEVQDDRIKSLESQLANQCRANEKLLQIVNQSQILQLEATESKKKLENQPKNLLSWIMAFFNQNKSKQVSDDN